MKKFDLKKMIAENKATFFSSLNEGYDEFKRAEKGSKDVTAKDKGEEEVYGAGVKKGEEIEKKKMKENLDSSYDDLYDFVDQKMVEGDEEAEMLLNSNPSYDDLYDFVDQKMVEGDDEAEALLNKINNVNENKSSKMKMSELKAKIKEMVLAEMTLDIDNMEDAPESEVDFLAELEEMLNEADKDTEKDTAETDVTVDDTETIDTETTTEVDPNVKAVQDALTQAQAAAQKLGDKKLTDQIGNTITFFTRTHVVEKPGGAVAENLNEESKITNSLVKFLDLHELTPEEMKDYEYIGNLIDNYAENMNTEFSDDEKIDLAKQYENMKSLNESRFPMLKKILK
jgi:uncharacterized protein YuzB (UPF0349 family)